ncbi:cold-shock protein [Polymorphobacter fuscus]|uniref:Cold-shock protein n=1 Tax=Sandarakinorhabdus fusca TaxID=1439888 RepID=A0A7C9KXA1_9SPHN|nr:cold shock domain-containing protein [Polymorphobacter fuscus]KAB7646124.1 cold shock domain-containing protein [Polymorphobacter fuscus]MQT17322.1 cold-shock protein [Polymorphobacter fuscus]NJC10145.1 cold shock CspA family protein [Polymorphobacter fuscus]
MASGAVKWFNAAKGFGFITPDLGPCDVFVHVSALTAAAIDRLEPGDRLEFELTQGGDGRLLALGLRRPMPTPDQEPLP